MTPLQQAAYDIGAKGSEPTENERLAFEAWMRGHCWKVVGDWDGKQYKHDCEDGEFIHDGAMGTRRLWAAWRDRGAVARVLAEQAQAVEPVAWIGDSPSRGNGKRLFWSKSEAYAYANKYEPLYTHPAPPAQQVAAPAKSEPLSPSELHLVYCNDSSAGDWHRAKENYVAGFTAAERHHGIKAKPAHTDWSAA